MTLATSISKDLNGLEIPSIPKTAKDLDTLQRAMAQQAPILATMLAYLKEIQAGGSTGDYVVTYTSTSIFIGHKDANPAGLGAGYAGDLRVGIYMAGGVMELGSNNKTTGVWEAKIQLSASGMTVVGNLYGEHATGTINGANVTVSATTMADIRTGALRAIGVIDGSNNISGAAVSGTSLTISGFATVGVLTAASGISMGAGSYILRPFSTTGRMTLYNQTFPYGAIATVLYEYHL